MPVSTSEVMVWISGGGCEESEKESGTKALEASSATGLVRAQVHLLLTSDLCSARQLRGL